MFHVLAYSKQEEPLNHLSCSPLFHLRVKQSLYCYRGPYQIPGNQDLTLTIQPQHGDHAKDRHLQPLKIDKKKRSRGW